MYCTVDLHRYLFVLKSEDANGAVEIQQQQIGKCFSLCSSLPREPVPLFQVLETFGELDAEAISHTVKFN